MFSAYLLDPENGWQVRPGLSLSDAVTLCKDFRNDWAGSVVAVAPDGADPDPYLELASTAATNRFVDSARLTAIYYSYGHCDTCGSPCDSAGCVGNRSHLAAFA